MERKFLGIGRSLAAMYTCIFRKIDRKSSDISRFRLFTWKEGHATRREINEATWPSTEKLTTLSRFALSDRGPAETEQLMPAGNYN